MSQATLAEQLDISYQQIQRYEAGANRIPATRLHEIAQLFDTPVEWFFDQLVQDCTSGKDGSANGHPIKPRRILRDKDALQLVYYFQRLKHHSQRQTVIALMRAMVEPSDKD